ncbi:MAG: hypothetical protein H7Y27_11355 [Gemmatimonadaceae bacterium]|nr:hypothetical protein [Chitinophagaceae bacterium]
MSIKVKSPVFIDTLKLECVSTTSSNLKGVLKDEKGSVCSTFESEYRAGQEEFMWRGLNDLPYGVYTLELSQGEDAMQMRLVKRV